MKINKYKRMRENGEAKKEKRLTYKYTQLIQLYPI